MHLLYHYKSYNLSIFDHTVDQKVEKLENEEKK